MDKTCISSLIYVCFFNSLGIMLAYLSFYLIDKYEFPSFLYFKKFDKNRKVKINKFSLNDVFNSSIGKKFYIHLSIL